jgi:hypothetical protein
VYPGEYTSGILRVRNSDGGFGVVCVPETSTVQPIGNFGTGAISTFGVEAMPDGLLRFWVSGTISGASTSTNLELGVRSGTLEIFAGNGTDKIFFGRGQLNKGELQPYYPTTSSAYFGPRINYNPVATPVKGKILAEEARTNHSYNNTMLGAVIGRIGSGGVLPNNWLIQGAGLGTLNLDIVDIIPRGEARELVLEFSGTASVTETRIAFQPNTQVAATQGQTWALSAYMRRISGGMSNINGFDLSVVERTSGGLFIVDTLAPINISDTLQRPACVRTLDRSNTAFINSAIVLKPVVGQQVNLRFSVLVNQLELGPAPSSPMLTYGAPFTRGADNLSMTDMSWYQESGGVLYCDWDEPATAQIHQIVYLSSPSSTERVNLSVNNSNVLDIQVVSGGSDSFGGQTPTMTPGRKKVAFSFAQNNAGFSLNGMGVVRDTTVNLPSGVDRMFIGNTINLNQYLNGEISRIAFIPDTSISDSTLQKMTK